MLRRPSRRRYRLVRLGAPNSCLDVLTGMRTNKTTRAGGRAGGRARRNGRSRGETARRRMIWLVVNLVCVLTGRRRQGRRLEWKKGGMR